MQNIPFTHIPDQPKRSSRASAGKTLAVFFVLMLALTMANSTLQEMTIATVTPIIPQRGALEKQINSDGVLTASTTIPIIVRDSVRAVDILVKDGAPVKAGDPLITLDYTDIIADRYDALVAALQNTAQRQQALDWAAADLSTSAMDKLQERRDDYLSAKDDYMQAEIALNTIIREEDLAQEKVDSAKQALDAALSTDNQAAISTARETHEQAVSYYDATHADRQKAQRAYDEAADSYDTEKQDLDDLTNVRTYLTKEEELRSAEDELVKAHEDFIAMMDQVDNIEYPAKGHAKYEMPYSYPSAAYSSALEDIGKYDPLAQYTITQYAPVDGDVLSIDVEPGEQVSTNKPVMSISDASKGLALYVQVDEDQVEEIAVGAVADILIGEDTFQSAVTSISPLTDSSGMFEIGFLLPGNAGSAGIQASMRFRKRTTNYDVLVPLSALREDNDGDFVYVVEQQESSLGARMYIRRLDVYVLDQDSTRAAIQGGISQRDLVVARSDREIGPSDRVRLEED